MLPPIILRARGLVGVRFRAQGRDPATGLDCVGVLLAAYALPGDWVRADYRLRGNHRSEIEAMFGRCFRRVAVNRRRPGDALLLGIANDQLHLAVETGGGFVHADVAIGRVVETPGPPPWPILRAFRTRQVGGER